MPAVDLQGTTIHYEIDGEGPPLFVLHGGLGIDHQLYRRTMHPLADDHRLVYLDHRGNGRSARGPIDSMAQLADDVVALADHLGLDRFGVLGHSYGGFVAQELAIRHPARVARLVLVTTTPGQLGTDEDPASIPPGPDMPAALADLFGEDSSSDAHYEALLGRMLPHYFHRTSMDDVAPLLAGTVFSYEASHAGGALMASWSSVDRLREITCPTLLVAGRHDVVTSWPQSQHRIAPRIAGAEVVVLENSGHFPWIEEPDAFFDAVGTWLRR